MIAKAATTAAKPIAARSGVYCFTDLKLPATDYFVEVKPVSSDRDRYFDVVVEYAKADVEDILVKITVTNRGAEAASINLLPTICFLNTW